MKLCCVQLTLGPKLAPAKQLQCSEYAVVSLHLDQKMSEN